MEQRIPATSAIPTRLTARHIVGYRERGTNSMENWIASLPFWKDLSTAQQQLVMQTGTVQCYEKDQAVYDNLSIEIGHVLVREGQLSVGMQTEKGAQLTLYRLGPEDSAICPLFMHANYADVYIQMVAEAPSIVFLIPMKTFLQLQADNVCVNQYNRKQEQYMFQLVLHLIEKLAFSNLKSRLIAQLVGYARVQNTNTLSVTHEALANDLGTSREVVTRLLKQLEDKNVVKLERKKILLLKKDFPSDA